VYFRSELPKTNVGKILRRALRDELREAPGSAASKRKAL
jgi:acyl-coenzyme A synthetase/AMP-(fatty) acid ligase